MSRNNTVPGNGALMALAGIDFSINSYRDRKVHAEGDVGAYRGHWDKDGNLKYA